MHPFKNILIIDDDEIFLIVTKAIMETEGFAEHVIDFMDPFEAIEYFKKEDNKNSLPELIFLDINMPMMDGWEFIAEMERLELSAKVKIFITSSSINPMDLEKAENSVIVQSFIDKPISPKKLKVIVEKFGK